MTFYQDARRYAGPRLWWLRARHVVLDQLDRQLHRLLHHDHLRSDGGFGWDFCDDVEELFIQRLEHDPDYERRLVAAGRLSGPFVTMGPPERS